MIRSVTTAAGAAAIVVAGLAGCSNDKTPESRATDRTDGATTTASVPTSQSSGASATAAAGTAKVTIDGQPKELQGQVMCAVTGDNVNIAIGEQLSGVAVSMARDASNVMSVGLGNVNGVALGYQQGATGSASATKDGNTYTIEGSATGVDMANPLQPITKPFTIEVSCP